MFTQEQLDQMLAPIALYPDPLLAQVLMASTYPGEIAEAVTWSKAHPDAKGDDAVKQVANQTWDPSVQALVAFPQVLATLGQDPVWVQRLGDAFLAQPDDLMNGVQRLRRQAQAAGNLQSNQYQNVTIQNAPAPAPASAPAAPAPASSSSTIIIQPADPQVVYVPTYNPTTTYGTWAYPASPPVYYPPPPAYYPGQALVAGLAFGTGVAIVASLWGDCDWGNNDVDIDVNRYNNINRNNQITNNQNKWQHNAVHRDGVPYRDNRSREQFGRQLNGANQREAFRGDTAQRAQAREKARSSMDRHGIERPATSNRQARDQARKAQSDTSIGNRMQAGADRPRASDRGQGTARNSRENQQPRNQTAQTNQRREQFSQARQGGERRQAASPGSARNNAFAGARSPSQTNLQAARGRASQASASRPRAERTAGRQISRPSSAPMRQRGGGRR
uniref:Putative exported protein n=1 Tax=Pseudomonas sp. (strain WBC-3) TaxID=165468 RepID=A0A0A0RIQ1_PSEWB|nr:putative exported protein [Pseudomonas sp. WBC-3]